MLCPKWAPVFPDPNGSTLRGKVIKLTQEPEGSCRIVFMGKYHSLSLFISIFQQQQKYKNGLKMCQKHIFLQKCKKKKINCSSVVFFFFAFLFNFSIFSVFFCNFVDFTLFLGDKFSFIFFLFISHVLEEEKPLLEERCPERNIPHDKPLWRAPDPNYFFKIKFA